jgi:uncharacterized protein YfdQ (DUF2303 family)
MADKTEIQTALDATIAGTVLDVAGAPHAVVPGGYHIQDLTDHLPAPLRLKGKLELRDVKSFVAQFNEFKTSVAKLFGTVNPPRFVGVLNGNAASAPGWGDHRIEYSCPLSVEWKTWTAKNKQPMTQADFAQFVEDNLPDLLNGAEMLEISRTLEAKKKVNFASGIRLADGQNEFTYEEQIEGTAGKGKFKVPEVFELGIAVFEGGPLYKVSARLRYRIGEGGKLALWYDLERPHKILEDAVKAVWTEIESGTATTILHAAV